MYCRGGEQGRLDVLWRELNITPVECVWDMRISFITFGVFVFPDEQKERVTFWHRGPRHEFCSRVAMVRVQFSP